MNDTVMQGKLGQSVGSDGRVSKQVMAAERILSTLFEGFKGSVDVDLWGEHRTTVGSGRKAFALKVNDPACIRKVVMGGGPLSLAEAHFRGEIDYEGDIYEVLALRHHFQAIQVGGWGKLKLLKDAMALTSTDKGGKHAVEGKATGSFRKSHSRESDRAAVQHHYDVSNEFYEQWLDRMMVYSCGYFETPEDTIDKAQENKLNLVCRKLQLKPGEKFLDIGCGWGAMVCWAAKNFGVKAHGITLSEAQLKVAKERIRREGLSELVTVELRDYRDLEGVGTYDKVSSIGMFEHVGLKALKEYNATVYRVLADNGLFLNHGITHAAEGWDTGLNSKFLQQYVFPDGELDRVSSIANGMESAGFEIIDVENLRFHYAQTLRAWVKRLEENRRAAQGFVGEQRYKIWRMYMAGSALEFEEGTTGIHQILAAKWSRKQGLVPPTRGYMMSERAGA